MMQIFLGDDVTLVKDFEPVGTFISGQVSGVTLDEHKKLERVWIQGIEVPFWMSQGWKFVDYIEEKEDDEDGEI